MIEVAIMIEGQDGLTWPRWRKLAAASSSAPKPSCARSWPRWRMPAFSG